MPYDADVPPRTPANTVVVKALPIYHSLALATVAYANSDLLTCLLHMTRINKHLPPVLKAYYDRLHDAKIARSAWLSHVQGFFAWGAGEIDPATGRFIQYDGLSGNQALLFIALDSFLGLDSYLPPEIAHRNIPRRQREFAAALSRHSFRADVERRRYGGGVEAAITKEFSIIVKRLRVS